MELALRMSDAVLAFVERADELNLPPVNPCAEMFPYDDVWGILRLVTVPGWLTTLTGRMTTLTAS